MAQVYLDRDQRQVLAKLWLRAFPGVFLSSRSFSDQVVPTIRFISGRNTASSPALA